MIVSRKTTSLLYILTSLHHSHHHHTILGPARAAEIYYLHPDRRHHCRLISGTSPFLTFASGKPFNRATKQHCIPITRLIHGYQDQDRGKSTQEPPALCTGSAKQASCAAVSLRFLDTFLPLLARPPARRPVALPLPSFDWLRFLKMPVELKEIKSYSSFLGHKLAD